MVMLSGVEFEDGGGDGAIVVDWNCIGWGSWSACGLGWRVAMLG